MYAVTHIAHGINRRYGEHVSLVVREIGVSLDSCRNVFEFCTLLEFYVHHAAVQSFALRYSHRESVLHALLRAHAYAVTHRHARSEVGVAESLRCETLHQSAHDRVGTRVPTGSDDAHRAVLLAHLRESAAVVDDRSVYIEAVYGVDAECSNLLCVLLARACRSSKDSYVHVLQFANVLHYLVLSQFGRLVLRTVTAHYTSNLKVIGSLKRLNRIMSDVAVSNYGCSNLFHVFHLYIKYLYGMSRTDEAADNETSITNGCKVIENHQNK